MKLHYQGKYNLDVNSSTKKTIRSYSAIIIYSTYSNYPLKEYVLY